MEIQQHKAAKYYLLGIGWAVVCQTRREALELAYKQGWEVKKYKGLPGFFVQEGNCAHV